MAKAPWPPPSPWVWTDSWWGTDGLPYDITLWVRFDSTTNADGTPNPAGTLALQGVDYDIDPNCPWRYIIVDKPDGTRIAQQIPQGGRTGTIGKNALNTRGLVLFTDIGDITAGVTNSLTK